MLRYARGELMKKTILLLVCVFFVGGCGLYGTTKYSVDLNAQQADFSQPDKIKKASTCSFLLLGFIPWPWHKHKTPDTLFEAIAQQQIQQIVWIDSTYLYKITYGYACNNVYGY